MMEKHHVVQRGGKPCSPEVAAARAAIWETLNAKKSVLSEHENTAYRCGRAMPAAAEYRGLLNEVQVEYLKEIQLRCFKIDMEAQEINTRLVNADLSGVLPNLCLVEVTDLLYKIDVLVQQVYINARKLGVEAVQPKINMAYLDYRLRGKGSREDLARAAVKAAERKALAV